MTRYKDRKFCSFYTNCRTGMDCDKALTKGVEILAGAEGRLLDEFQTLPECYRELRGKEDYGSMDELISVAEGLRRIKRLESLGIIEK